MLEAENIKGFGKLTPASANMFRGFLKNFYKTWGLEARKTIEPVSVKHIKGKNEKYLRFDYKVYNKKYWVHVMDPTTWY